MNGGKAYDIAIRTLSVVFVVIGITILGLTLVNGGGPISTGFLIGLAFIGIGAARYRLHSKMVDGE